MKKIKVVQKILLVFAHKISERMRLFPSKSKTLFQKILFYSRVLPLVLSAFNSENWPVAVFFKKAVGPHEQKMLIYVVRKSG